MQGGSAAPVGRERHLAREVDESMAQCKICPADPSKIIVVLLLRQGSSDPDQKTYDLDILLVKATCLVQEVADRILDASIRKKTFE